VRVQPRLFGAGFGGHLRVVNENELADLCELVFILSQLLGQLHDLGEPLVVAAERGEEPGVPDGSRVEQLPLDLAEAADRFGESIAETQAVAF
jgi:hypothetical protein